MEKLKVIFDTDMGSDCDDAGALSLLHHLADEGKVDILATTHCASEIGGSVTIKVMNEWYKRPDIPIGRYDTRTFLEREDCKVYTREIMEGYLKNHRMPGFENSVRVMRRILSENTDVILIVVGMLNNVADLLRSMPDDISSMNGVELVKNSVREMYSMGGHFTDPTYAEYNIKSDIENAKYIAENFPRPITYCGFELGENLYTGSQLADAGEDNPVRIAYYNMLAKSESKLRNSWDPITTYCAIEQDSNLYEKRGGLTISFDDEGRAVVEEGGKDAYMVAAVEEDEIKEVIDKLIW